MESSPQDSRSQGASHHLGKPHTDHGRSTLLTALVLDQDGPCPKHHIQHVRQPCPKSRVGGRFANAVAVLQTQP